jgi:hypothetical protein
MNFESIHLTEDQVMLIQQVIALNQMIVEQNALIVKAISNPLVKLSGEQK